ncbi:MAG: serine/threonine-protein phosphatase [Alphaproteobacteria bacterium]|nr:serine/threonine-protein phosphatase [Alphaproteobacteria bacterium]
MKHCDPATSGITNGGIDKNQGKEGGRRYIVIRTSANIHCRSAARTHAGTVRWRNEDAILERPEIGLWAVADGAGGHERGDYASARIIAALGSVPPAPSAFLLVNDVKDRLSEINRDLRRKAATLGPRALIASTVAVLLVLGNQGCCLWAGDSRLYRLRAGQLRQLSHDHSYVQNLVDRGEIGPEAAATHPLSNIVTNLVGGADELLLEERRHALEPGDVMLLCSDGLSGAVSDTEIAAVLSARPAQNAADGLIDLALAKRTRDNVSVVVMEYGV